MKRKNFIKQPALATGGLPFMHNLFASKKDKVYGYNGMTYNQAFIIKRFT